MFYLIRCALLVLHPKTLLVVLIFGHYNGKRAKNPTELELCLWLRIIVTFVLQAQELVQTLMNMGQDSMIPPPCMRKPLQKWSKKQLGRPNIVREIYSGSTTLAFPTTPTSDLPRDYQMKELPTKESLRQEWVSWWLFITEVRIQSTNWQQEC